MSNQLGKLDAFDVNDIKDSAIVTYYSVLNWSCPSITETESGSLVWPDTGKTIIVSNYSPKTLSNVVISYGSENKLLRIWDINSSYLSIKKQYEIGN